MSRTFYVRRQSNFDKHFGPYEHAKLKSLAENSHLQPADQLSVDRKSWVAASTIEPSLFPSAMETPASDTGVDPFALLPDFGVPSTQGQPTPIAPFRGAPVQKLKPEPAKPAPITSKSKDGTGVAATAFPMQTMAVAATSFVVLALILVPMLMYFTSGASESSPTVLEPTGSPTSITEFFESVQVRYPKGQNDFNPHTKPQAITTIIESNLHQIDWYAPYSGCSDSGVLSFRHESKDGLTLHFICDDDKIDKWQGIETGTDVRFRGYLSRDIGFDLYPVRSVVPSHCGFYSGDSEPQSAVGSPWKGLHRFATSTQPGNTWEKRHLHVCVANCLPVDNSPGTTTEQDLQEMVQDWKSSKAAIVGRNESGQIVDLLHVAPIRKLPSLNIDVQLGMKNENTGWPKTGWWIARGTRFPTNYWNFRCSHLTNEQFLMLGELEHLESLLVYSDRLTDEALQVGNRFPKLNSLTIFNSAITSEGIANLRSALPNCKVSNNGGAVPDMDDLQNLDEPN